MSNQKQENDIMDRNELIEKHGAGSVMSKLNRHSDRERAKATIDGIVWFTYTNIPLGLTINIQRTLIDDVGEHIGNAFDAGGAIAAFAIPHIDRLKSSGCDFGQSEGFVQIPFEAAWHILVMDGQCYVADQEFYPYRNQA